MNNRNIQEIVRDFLEGNAASEIIPCIFHVTLVAAAEKPLESISENDQRNMYSLLSFIYQLDKEFNSVQRISREGTKQYLDSMFKDFEAAISNTAVFLDDNESLELVQRMKKFESCYNELIDFINEKLNV